MNTGIIYLHKNKVNGKVYVGQTVQNRKRRFRPGKMAEAYKTCILLYRAILLHGESNFETLILEENIPFDKLNEREEYYMKFYDSTNPEKGYNIRIVSEGRQIQSEETRKKISEKAKQKFANGFVQIAYNKHHHIIKDEITFKICSKCKIEKTLDYYGYSKKTWDKLMRYCKPCWNFNKKLSMSKKTKMTAEQIQQSYKNRSGNKIKAVDINGNEIVFNSIREAGRSGFIYSRVYEILDKEIEYKGYKFYRIKN